MKYKSFGPDAEVYGAAMMAFIKSINYANFGAILKAHELDEIIPDRWYPQQIWLDVFSEISQQMDASSNLVSIGLKIVEAAQMPPEVQQMPFIDIMKGFEQGSYKTNNRGADIGSIDIQIVNDHHIIMIDRTPYPDDFVYGAYYGMARRFLPEGTDFILKYDEKMKRREAGGQSTNVHIIWE